MLRLPRRIKILIAVLTTLILIYAIPIPRVGIPVEELELGEGGFIEVDGLKVYYVEKGSGNITFLLLHGFGASTFSWRYVVNEFSKYGRVVAFDRPGFGLTERKPPGSMRINPYSVEGSIYITCKLAEILNITRVVIIGHSMGGGLALLIADKCNYQVEGVVLVAPAWKQQHKGITTYFLLHAPLSNKLGPLLIRGLVGQLEQVLYNAWYNKSKLTSEVLEGYKYPLNALDWDKGLYWIIKYYEFPGIDGVVSRIKYPVLIIHGRQDEIVPLDSSIELTNKLSRYTKTELKMIEECGHLPHEEKPEEFNKLLLEFINSYILTTH